jgi:spore coat polysaccharide biosynthesis protein SpsF
MIFAILQARTSSTRLPGKVLKPILGRPMLSLQIERIQRSKKIDKIIVATSNDRSDSDIENLCINIQIPCFRGSLDDVLDRFYQTAMQYKLEHVVRLTGDCPLIDPIIIDKVISFYLEGDFDYATNSMAPYTFPDGLDVEVFGFSVLEKAWHEAILPSHREHVTPFIRLHPEIFKVGYYKNETDLSHLRWTVDEPEDFEFVSQIYKELYPQYPIFITEDILELINRKPSLLGINSHVERNMGSKKSEEADKLFSKKL